MRRIKRTEVTIETDEILVFKGTQTPVLPLCPQCCDPMPMITPQQAADMVSATARTIYRWVEEDRIHNVETADGLVFICPRSLFLAGLLPQ